MKLSKVLRARSLLFFAGLAAALINWRYTTIVRSQQEPAVIDTVASVRVRLGVNDTAPTDWSGSVNVPGGQLAGLRQWRPRPGDKVDGAAFTVATRTGAPFVYRAWEDAPLLPERPYLLTPGIIVDTKAARTAILRIETKHGAFEVSPFALEAGQSEKYLGGRVIVDRVPFTETLSSPERDADFATVLAHPSGELWTAWIEYAGAGKNSVMTRRYDGRGRLPVRYRARTPMST